MVVSEEHDMAGVRLSRADLNALPPVCVYCGAAAERYERERFLWLPWWAYLVLPLLFLVLAVHPASLIHAPRLVPAFYKDVTLWLPYCAGHLDHRSRRRRGATGPFLRTAVVAALVATVVPLAAWVLAALGAVGGQAALEASAVTLAGAGGAVALAGLRLLWLTATGLRVARVTTYRGEVAGVTLANVAPEFAHAVEHQREALPRAEALQPPGPRT
jgi:hypothetical protein